MSMPHLLTITVILNWFKVYQLLTCVQKVFLQHPMTTRYSALLIKSSSKHFQVKKSCTSSKEAKNITCKCACLNFIMFNTKDRDCGPNCCFWVCTQNFSTVLSLYFKTCQSDWKNTTKTITWFPHIRLIHKIHNSFITAVSKPLTSRSDSQVTSPCNIHTLSSKQEMRILKLIR